MNTLWNLPARVLASAVLAAATLIVSLPTGCAGSTGSKRFEFAALAGGVQRNDSGALTFTNERGWIITLTRAEATIGPIYLNVNAPLSSGSTGLLNILGRDAYATGEEFLGSGRVVGEVLGRVQFDALSPTLRMFPTNGSIAQELVRTTDMCFYPPADTPLDAVKTNSPTLEVEGAATRGAETIKFRGALVLNEAWLPAAAPGARDAISIANIRRTRGISSEFFPTEGGKLEIRMNVQLLFRGADFASLEGNPQASDGTKLLVQSQGGKVNTDQVMINLFQGLKASRGTFEITWN